MNVVLVGTSHRHAPVELRELIAFGSGRAGEIAATLAGEDGEAVALSTCNRTELYLACDDSAGSLYTLVDEDAVVHLFRVAAGLDSMIRGEGQILGQIRSAYEAAQEADATGPALHRLFRHALRAGKRVRTETGICQSRAPRSAAIHNAPCQYARPDGEASDVAQTTLGLIMPSPEPDPSTSGQP